MEIAVRASRFIEDGFVPSDARVVDHTWKYVNRSGGPDRRFKNNRQLPVCLYDELTFSSASGLNEVIQVSRTGLGADLASAVEALGRALPREAAS